jgi:hypothetical protein
MNVARASVTDRNNLVLFARMFRAHLSRKRRAFCCSERELRGSHPFVWALLRLTYSNDILIRRTTHFATGAQQMRCVIHTLRYACRLRVAFMAHSATCFSLADAFADYVRGSLPRLAIAHFALPLRLPSIAGVARRYARRS